MRAALLLSAFLLAAPARAQERAAPSFLESSLLGWTEAVAEALLGRAGEGGVRLQVEAGRGVDERKAATTVGAHLRRRLADAGRAWDRGPVATVVVSLEGGEVWAVGVVEHPSGARSFAASWPVDRELEAVLGARTPGAGQGVWTFERVGAIPSGVLSIALLDLDGDDRDELVVLSIDGVRTLTYDAADGRPRILGGPWPLPPRPWPLVVDGVLVAGRGGSVELWTSAGHSLSLDARSGRMVPGEAGVPLRVPLGVERGPSAGAPLVRADGVVVTDRWPYPGGGWIQVGADGVLGGDAPCGQLPGEPVGDRVALADFDRDGDVELVTTGPGAPGSPDRITVHDLDARRGSSVLFSGTLADGSVAALDVGDLDFDGHPDLVVVEAGRGEWSTLWRLERGR